MDIGPSEAETFWTAFLRKLARRGLRGVKLVVSDAHEGIKATVAKVLNASWQRWRVHFMRNAPAHAGKSGRRVVSAFIATAFAQDDAEAARTHWRKVADQLRPKLPKLAGFLEEAETDVLAYMTFPPQHRTKLHSTDEMDKRFFHDRDDDCRNRVRPFFCSAAPRAILPSRPPISQPPRAGPVKAGRVCGHRKAWP